MLGHRNWSFLSTGGRRASGTTLVSPRRSSESLLTLFGSYRQWMIWRTLTSSHPSDLLSAMPSRQRKRSNGRPGRAITFMLQFEDLEFFTILADARSASDQQEGG